MSNKKIFYVHLVVSISKKYWQRHTKVVTIIGGDVFTKNNVLAVDLETQGNIKEYLGPMQDQSMFYIGLRKGGSSTKSNI